MSKKVKNILFGLMTGLLLIVNSGFTVTLSHCNMDEEMVSSGCDMCCSMENDNDCGIIKTDESNGPVLSSIPVQCCTVRIASITGTDDYLLNFFDSANKPVQLAVCSLPNLFSYESYTNENPFLLDASPPGGKHQQIYLSVQNLRI